MKKYIFFLTCLCFAGLCGSAGATTVKVGRNGVFTTTDAVKQSVSECTSGQIRIGGVCIYPDNPITPQACGSKKVWSTDEETCIACPDNCVSCTETCTGTTKGKYCTRNGTSQMPYTYTCTNCDTGFSLNPTTKVCEHSCPDGKVWSEKAGDCVTSCPDGQILHPSLGHCVPEGGCLSPYCTSCPDLQGCLTCQEGYSLNENGVCTSICPKGEVYNPVIQRCVAKGCGNADLCSNCVSTALGDYCTACNSQHVAAGKLYLSPTDGLCHECRTGPEFSPPNSPHCEYCGNVGRELACRSCQEGYALNPNGTCTSPVPSCPEGKFWDLTECSDCPKNCVSCYASIYPLTGLGVGRLSANALFRCTACAEGFKMSEEFKCVPDDTPVCGEGEYTQYDGTCKACPDGCSSCKETCSDGMILIANGVCGKVASKSVSKAVEPELKAAEEAYALDISKRATSIVSCVTCKHNIDAECINIWGSANPWHGTGGGYYWCADGTHTIPEGKTCWEGYGHYQTITISEKSPSYTAVSLRFWGNTTVKGDFSTNYLSVGLNWNEKTSPATFTFDDEVTVNTLFILKGDDAVFNKGIKGETKCYYQYGAGTCTCSKSTPTICN